MKKYSLAAPFFPSLLYNIVTKLNKEVRNYGKSNLTIRNMEFTKRCS